MIYAPGTPDPPQPFILAPEKVFGGGGSGSSRPMEGKMFPRGTGK